MRLSAWIGLGGIALATTIGAMRCDSHSYQPPTQEAEYSSPMDRAQRERRTIQEIIQTANVERVPPTHENMALREWIAEETRSPRNRMSPRLVLKDLNANPGLWSVQDCIESIHGHNMFRLLGNAFMSDYDHMGQDWHVRQQILEASMEMMMRDEDPAQRCDYDTERMNIFRNFRYVREAGRMDLYEKAALIVVYRLQGHMEQYREGSAWLNTTRKADYRETIDILIEIPEMEQRTEGDSIGYWRAMSSLRDAATEYLYFVSELDLNDREKDRLGKMLERTDKHNATTTHEFYKIDEAVVEAALQNSE